MVVYTQEELENLLCKTFGLFCTSNFVYNKVLELDAVIKFKIDREQEITCTLIKSFPATARTQGISVKLSSSIRRATPAPRKLVRQLRNKAERGTVKKEFKPVPSLSETSKVQDIVKNITPVEQQEISQSELTENDGEIKTEPTDQDIPSCDDSISDNEEGEGEEEKCDLSDEKEDKLTEKKPRHSCSFCGKVYDKPNRLAVHERTHTGEKPYSCLKCGKSFISPSGHKAHRQKGCVDRRKKGSQEALALQTQSDNEDVEDLEGEDQGTSLSQEIRQKRKTCQYCGRTFSKPSRLIVHERTHSGERPFKCSKCGRGYISIQGLRAHEVKGCEDKRKRSRRQPFVLKPPPQHPCSYCGKVYQKRNRLLIHERTKHTGERPFLCATCGKSYASKMTLNQHSLTHNRDRSYECQICPAKFLLPYTLKVHMRVHTGERPHVCWHCGRSFRQYGSFQIHLRTHTKEKPLKCSMCEQRFAHRSLLQKHKMMHLGERQFTCHQCGKKFWTSNDLKTHQKTHLGIRKHVCSLCNMRFTQTSSLKRHMEGHAGNNKVHHCPVCGKSFTRSHQVTIHMKAHVPDSPYRCQICGTNFKSMTGRKVHMETHHQGEMAAESSSELALDNQTIQGQVQDQQQQQLQQPLQQTTKINLDAKLDTENIAYRAPVHLQQQQQQQLQQQQHTLNDLPADDITFSSPHFPQSLAQALSQTPGQSIFHHHTM